MSDGMGREPAYLSSHATNRYFIPNWGTILYYSTFQGPVENYVLFIEQQIHLAILLSEILKVTTDVQTQR